MSSLSQKLRLQPSMRALVLNPPQDYQALVGPLPEDVVLDQEPAAQAGYDFVHVFTRDRAELDRLMPRALQAVVYDGVFWVSYPKRSSGVDTDLSRDVFWELVPGMRPVTQVSVDKTWSALRFRPAERVGT